MLMETLVTALPAGIPASKRLERQRVQDRTREGGERQEADAGDLIKQTAMTKLSPSTPCHFACSDYTSKRLGRKNRRERDSRPFFHPLKSTLLPDSLGKAGFRENSIRT